ncbi:MAG: hypothetical protein Q7T86_03305 [Hyphomicrobiaceae bacterium]|nr:hypothetical protein [Hyphomicrobiaceae bacterium]
MRYWLTVQAGPAFVEVVKQQRLPDWADADELAAFMTAFIRTSTDDNQFVDIDGRLASTLRAKSTATMEHREYNALCSAIDDVLSSIGLQSDKLLSERAA